MTSAGSVPGNQSVNAFLLPLLCCTLHCFPPATLEHTLLGPTAPKPEWVALMDAITPVSTVDYRSVVFKHPRFVEYFRAVRGRKMQGEGRDRDGKGRSMARQHQEERVECGIGRRICGQMLRQGSSGRCTHSALGLSVWLCFLQRPPVAWNGNVIIATPVFVLTAALSPLCPVILPALLLSR